jgi:hypothetical protein
MRLTKMLTVATVLDFLIKHVIAVTRRVVYRTPESTAVTMIGRIRAFIATLWEQEADWWILQTRYASNP